MIKTSYCDSALKRYLGEERYDELRAFYYDTWFSEPACRFRVYLAQKSANLNEILYRQVIEELRSVDSDKAKELEKLQAETFMSLDGLVMQADTLAQAYTNGAFPQILIVDEACRTGEDIAELYYTLENAVLATLEKRLDGELDWGDVLRVRDDLRAAVKFRIFMLNENGLLIESDLRSRVRWVIRASDEEIYKFTQNISQAITVTPGVENSAFVPTFYVPDKDYTAMEDSLENEGNWHSERWRYREATSFIWDKAVCSDDRVKLYYTVRATYMPTEEKYALTAYPFWGELGAEGHKRLAGFIRRKLLENGKFPRFCERLETDRIASNFVYFIVSVLTMTAFIEDTKCKKTNFPANDLTKMCRYFGTQAELGGEVKSFMASGSGAIAFRKELRDGIELFLRENAGALCSKPNITDFGVPNDVALFDAERYFGMRALDGQGSKFRRRRNSILFIGRSAFENTIENSLEHYLRVMGSDTLGKVRKRIGGVLLLCQQGYIGLKRTGANLVDEKECEFLLKAGEISESLRYQHLYRFMPALILFDRICKRNGLNTEDLAERFGDELHTEHGDEPEMGRIFRAFLEENHECGVYLEPYHLRGLMWNLSVPNRRNQVRTFAEWNHRQWSEEEWNRFDGFSRQTYMDWERDQQRKYMDKVMDFFERY